MTRTSRSILAALALASAPLLATASAEEGADKAPAPPEEIARATVEQVLDAMEGRRDELRRNPEELDAIIERILVPLIDIEYMSRLVLGRHWRDASEAQRERFQKAFKDMLIQTYGGALLGFKREQIEFMPVRAEKGAEDVTFRAKVKTESGETVDVDLNLHLVDGQWKIYNGSVGNLTFVTNYRGQFNQEIRRTSLETLIGKLESRYGGTPATAQKDAEDAQ